MPAMRPLPDLAYRLIGRFSVAGFTRYLHPRLYRRLGGRSILGRVLGAEQGILTTRGARSGRPRAVALFVFEDDGGWVVVGSRGGSGRVPDWVHNLVAEPIAFLQLHDRHVRVRALALEGEEYERAFERAAAAYPGFRLYRREADHHIPVYRLEPEEGVAEGSW